MGLLSSAMRRVHPISRCSGAAVVVWRSRVPVPTGQQHTMQPRHTMPAAIRTSIPTSFRSAALRPAETYHCARKLRSLRTLRAHRHRLATGPTSHLETMSTDDLHACGKTRRQQEAQQEELPKPDKTTSFRKHNPQTKHPPPAAQHPTHLAHSPSDLTRRLVLNRRIVIHTK